MADYRILLEADTARAEKDLRRVETVADAAARNRKLDFQLPDLNSLQRSFDGLKNNIEGAANNIRQFYGVSKLIPGIGEKVQNVEDAFKGTTAAVGQTLDTINRGVGAGDLLQRAFTKAADGADILLTTLGKIGLAMYGLEKIIDVVKSAFGKLFSETIGREIALRETLLKTQTTVASMSDVFVDGKQITDPLEKIKSLTKGVEKNVDSIRERSLELAGVTSNEVVEVFGIVAGQIGQVGGGLKEAEDLAISFAAALGTFGVPLQQARQEITSMLQGNIGADSYLARALGITNADIAKARTQTDGVIGYIQKKLETAVAGQKLAAQSFSGVTSNIRELGEIIGQRFGRGLLDPLLAGLTAVYNALSTIKDTLYELADTAGRTIGAVMRIAAVNLSAGIFGNVDVTATLTRVAEQAKAVASTVFAELGRIANNTVQALIQVVNAIKPAIMAAAQAFMVLVKAFAELKVGQFQAVVSALANIVSAVSPAINVIAGLVNAWAKFLDLPIIQYVSEVAVVLGLLKRMGLDAALGIAAFANFLLSAGVPAIARIGVAVGGFIVTLGLLIAAVGKVALSIAALAGAFLTPAAAIPALQEGLLKFITGLREAGGAAQQTGKDLGAAGAGMQAAGAAAKSMGMALLASLGKFALIQLAIAAAVDLFGRFQRAQQDAASQREFEVSLAYLEKNAKAAALGLDAATLATYDFHKAQAQGQINKNIEAIQKLDEELKRQEELLGLGKTGWDKFVHTLMYGTNVQFFAGEKAVELANKKKQLRAEIERVIAALKAEAAAEAEAYANSPKGRLEQRLKEAKAAGEILKTNQQIALNSIAQSQLSGAINEKESKRLETVQQINNVAAELTAKQNLLKDVLRIDPSNTEEIQKLKGEIATLEGKQINLQLNVNKQQFDSAVADIQRATTAAEASLQRQSNLVTLQASLAQARAQAEQAVNNALIAQLQTRLQNAKTDAERVAIANQIYDLEIANAVSVLRATRVQIAAELERQRIAFELARVKYKELEAIVNLARAQGQLTDAHLDALRAQESALYIAEDNYKIAKEIAKENYKAANATYEAAANAAELNRQTNSAAKNAGQFANSMEKAANSMGKAAGIQLSGFSSLEPWMEAEVQQAKQSAMSNALTRDPYAAYIAGVNAEIEARTAFEKQLSLLRNQQNLEAKASFYESLQKLSAPSSSSGMKPSSYSSSTPTARTSSQFENFYSSKTNEFSLNIGSVDPQINVNTGPVMQMDNTNYVTMNDFESGLRTTAQGVINTLRTPAGRSSIGVSGGLY